MAWEELERAGIKAYYKDEYVFIINADCREVLPELPKVDLSWTDPPYNVGKDYGAWSDNLSDNEYLSFCSNWIGELKRLSDGLVIYLPRKYALEYWQMLGNSYHQIILPWTPEGAIRHGFVNQFASLLTNAKAKQRTKDVWYKVQMRGMGYFFKENDYGHPGYTSEDVTSRVIMAFTIPDQTILDPFLGSGTTCYCAKKLLRKSIGIEVEEKYCEISANRCRQTVMELKI